jgi:hypothetical protein
LDAEQQFDLILKNGWRQGSVVSHELVRAANLPIEEAHQQHYLVVSHSCDLTNPRADLEPKVDVVRAEVTPAPEKDSDSSRNPRQLTLRARTAAAAEVSLLVGIATRQFLDRHLLITHQPSSDLWLPGDEIKLLALWMSRRYKRPELPTAFVNRLGNKFDKFKKLGRKNRTTFSRILISLNSWEELEEDQKYRVKLLGLLPPDVAIHQAAKDWATAVDVLLAEGIRSLEVEQTQVASESEVAISDLRPFKPIDFDFLSFASGEFDLPADD